MEVRDIKFDEEVQTGILNGAEKVYRAVKSTMGAKGMYVGIQTKFNENYVTKDGYYTARTIFLEDEAENIGAQMIKEVAKRSAEDAGDGTTTSTVLAFNIYKKAIEHINNGARAIDVKKGIQKAIEFSVKEIKKHATLIKNNKQMIKHVATVSANNDSAIGDLILEAYGKIKESGIIRVEEAQGVESKIEAVDGMRIESGYISPYFINNPEKMLCDLSNAHILIYDGTISTLKEILPVLEWISKQKGQSLLIIAINIEQEALATIIRNKMEGGMKVCAIAAPGHGKTKDTLIKDIEAATGAIIVSEKGGVGLETFQPEMLGSAKHIRITERTTEITEGGFDPDELKERINTIKNQLKEEKQPQSIEFHRNRLALIEGGVAVIHVGATTQVEMSEKKDLIEDAIASVKGALEEGILPGGGSALAKISKDVSKIKCDNDDIQIGVRIVFESMVEPLTTIMENAGVEPKAVLSKVLEHKDFNYGYNLNTDEYCDMIKSGIIDSAKVERLALENSSSVANMMLMTKTLIYTKNPS